MRFKMRIKETATFGLAQPIAGKHCRVSSLAHPTASSRCSSASLLTQSSSCKQGQAQGMVTHCPTPGLVQPK